MTDLTELLDRASDLGEMPMPVADDLGRAHAALRRQRRRRGLVGVGSVCAAGVLIGALAPTVLDRGPQDSAPNVVEGDKTDPALFAANQSAGPYTFGKLPRGWEVQGAFPQGVTIAPVGFEDQEPLSFLGKLVIMYDQNPLSGDRSTYNGREFFSRGDSDHTTVRVRTRAGEPEGVVSVQYPDSAGWSVETMIEFLDAVQVDESARPGLG
jgi:hypothetical protein